ncbi:alpha/beta hydrolase [Nocardioides sp. MH1]|uniref:alpha/beta hydrolase n=1 Tax=Nocardioides sp. MH1 TaxID=3242490 RepID=UPI0035215F7A
MNPYAVAERLALRAAMSTPLQHLARLRPVVVDGQTLAPDLQVMLVLQSLVRRRDEEVPIERMRRAMRSETALVGGTQPIGETRELSVAGRPARHYLPTRPAVAGPGPLFLFVHGGGFIEGDLDTHDAPCRVLAELSGVPVLALTYRLGPEHVFPAAHDDIDAAVRWVHEHADALGADPARIAIGGDSAGGNLAASAALTAAREGLPLAWQLLIYPCTDLDRDNRSLELFGEGFYLTREFMDRAERSHFETKEDLLDPRASVVDAEIPAGLAPAYVVTAGFDPLRDEGEDYARRLAEAGVEVELQRHPGLIHGFLNIVGVGTAPRAAVEELAGRLRAALV